LPWINYDDFVRGEFSAYLKAKRDSSGSTKFQPISAVPATTSKDEVIRVTRADKALVERDVRHREAAADQATPDSGFGLAGDPDACSEAAGLKARLEETPSGREAAAQYQRLVVEILNLAFSPDLVDGQPEVRTIDGTERRDIVFTNESDHAFWEYVRLEHSGIFLMFEVKNTEDLRPEALNQTATYLGDRLGRLGVVVTRQRPSGAALRKAMSIWNDSTVARKAILIWSDDDLRLLLDLRCQGQSTAKWVQQHYRAFRMSLQ
jgi:hypothetical protein